MGPYVFFIYTIRTIRNTLYHIGWWETKEYRFDRMKVHLFETVQGRRWMFGPLSLFKWFLILLYSFHFPEMLNSVVFALYTFEAVKNLFEFIYDKRPSGLLPKIFFFFFKRGFNTVLFISLSGVSQQCCVCTVHI